MSEPTAELLKKLGGYHLEVRGQREVKVRGDDPMRKGFH